MLAIGAAPAIVKASSIMRIKPVLLPTEDFAIPSGMAMMNNIGGNRLLTIDMITQEAMRILNQQMWLVQKSDLQFFKGTSWETE